MMLFVVDSERQFAISGKFQVLGGKVCWGFRFRRRLIGMEITNFVVLLFMLEKTFLSLDRDDERLWHRDSKRMLSAKSFHDVLIGFHEREDGWKKY